MTDARPTSGPEAPSFVEDYLLNILNLNIITEYFINDYQIMQLCY